MRTTWVLLIAAAAACESTTTSSDHHDLSDAQCSYYVANGKTTICHRTGDEIVTLRVAEAACANAHADHEGDFIAVDGNCGPNTCLPETAPCDATLPCCLGYNCNAAICREAPETLITLNPFDAATVRGNGFATYQAVGDYSNVSYQCVINGVVSEGCSWTGLGHGDELVVEVTATDLDTGYVGKTARRTALVDEQPPAIAFSGLAPGAVVGPRSDPFLTVLTEPDATLTCTLIGALASIVGDCTPNQPLQIDTIGDGVVCLTVTATDPFGNHDTAEFCFFTDATAPAILELTSTPTGDVCPTATLADVIRFTARDARPHELQPLSFACELDGVATACTQTGPQSGEYAWSGLAEGPHMLRVIAVDPFGNAGPVNDDGSLGVTAPLNVVSCP